LLCLSSIFAREAGAPSFAFAQELHGRFASSGKIRTRAHRLSLGESRRAKTVVRFQRKSEEYEKWAGEPEKHRRVCSAHFLTVLQKVTIGSRTRYGARYATWKRET